MLELKVSFKSTIYIRGPAGGNEMKIGELAGRSGLNASAIRYYERRGLLPAVNRDSRVLVHDETILILLYNQCPQEYIYVNILCINRCWERATNSSGRRSSKDLQSPDCCGAL